MGSLSQSLKNGQPVFIADHRLAMDQERRGADRVGARGNCCIAPRPIVSVARQQADAATVSLSQNAKPIVFFNLSELDSTEQKANVVGSSSRRGSPRVFRKSLGIRSVHTA